MREHIEKAASRFDRANPQVWRLFRAYTLRAIESGKRRIGAKMVWERIRWYAEIETDEECPKLNNNYTAYYARKWQRTYPGMASIFATREAASTVQGGAE